MKPTYAQRKAVIRDSCPKCMKTNVPRKLGEPMDEWLERRRGPGCEYCNGKGEAHFCNVCGEVMRPVCGGRNPEGGAETPCLRDGRSDPRMFSELKDLEPG